MIQVGLERQVGGERQVGVLKACTGIIYVSGDGLSPFYLFACRLPAHLPAQLSGLRFKVLFDQDMNQYIN